MKAKAGNLEPRKSNCGITPKHISNGTSKSKELHPLVGNRLGKVLQKQQGKCKWCELLFKEGDVIELDHIPPKNQGGKDDTGNLAALHHHCHDQRHAKAGLLGVNDNDHRVEELDEGITFTSSSEDE